MNTVSITNFRKDLYNMVDNTVRFSEPLNIVTRHGNAVMISENDYNDLIETLSLTSIPGMREKLTEGLRTPLEETVPENEVEW